MEITTKLKKRFCKDCNVPINLFKEPYFTDRLELFDEKFHTLNKWSQFIEDVSLFNNDEEYFAYYNKVKDNIINFIKQKTAYEKFLKCDMSQYSVPNYHIGRKLVFKPDNIGRKLVSIDLTKANYNAMRFFDNSLVNNTEKYEDFIKSFTNLKHLIESKYVRQVVFGNCNPKRQTTIEHYMMNFIIKDILKYIDIKEIHTFTDDEIVFNYNEHIQYILEDCYKTANEMSFEIHHEIYILNKVKNIDIYIKKLDNGIIDFKCVNALLYPILLRKYNNEDIQESDLVFFNEDYLSKLIEILEIEVV